MFKGALSGLTLRSALDNKIASNIDSISKKLAPYDAVVTPQKWHHFLQGTEELINFATEPIDDRALHDTIVTMPLEEAVGVRSSWLRDTISGLFDGGIENRILDVLRLIYSFDELRHALTTVGHVAGYLHSRRRRILALLYVMPQLCRGSAVARTTADLLPFLKLAEFECGLAIDLSQMRLLNYVFDDYAVWSDGEHYRGSRDIDLLDEGVMDPERVSIIDMLEHGVHEDLPNSDSLNPRLLLSKAECDHQIAIIEAIYKEFDLAGTSFAAVRDLIRPLLQGVESHSITVPAAPFLAGLAHYAAKWPELNRAVFVHDSADFNVAINGHQPFVLIDDQLVSNVTLLSRFVYAWRDRVLLRKKRFQIRSGFIFEKRVRAVLEDAGFASTSIRRVERKEFDVVMTRDNVIHNFQCKNTFIDASLIEGQPARYARMNNAMVRSYRGAINKERGREHLLKNKLGLQSIQHYVISRFPVQCDDLDIIPLARLISWVKNANVA